MTTGPGLPVLAMWKASLTTCGISPGSITKVLCLVMGRVMPVVSVSWKASVPMEARATCPTTATTGTESIWAVAMPVTRLVAPGPDVAQHTPTLPVTRA